MSTRQIGGLTALRFFAAFAILIHHAKGNFFPPEFLAGLPLDAGVTFFFVLSGFILSHVYSEKGIRGGLSRFYVARFARLWPAHAFCTLMLLACIPYQRELLESASNVYTLILNLLMLHAAVPIPDVYFSFNAVSWSISTEIFFYMAFPLLLLWFSSTPVLKLCAAIAFGGLFAYAGRARRCLLRRR
jgi:peptidoglycan/LPS O-acetylase OafA/YrhL